MAVLAGAWLNAYLASRARAAEQLERRRADAAAAIGPMVSLLLDAEPTLVLSGELREYTDPQAAVKGLYDRWLRAREPLLVAFAQPSPEVRDMGVQLQAEAEMLLRHLSKGDMDGSREIYARALGHAGDFAKRLSPVAD